MALPPEGLSMVKRHVRTPAAREAPARRAPVATDRSKRSLHSARKARLTRREREIVLAILDACTNREMAERFSVSEQTIKNQLSTLYDKLGVSTRLELALAAIRRRLGDEEPE